MYTHTHNEDALSSYCDNSSTFFFLLSKEIRISYLLMVTANPVNYIYSVHFICTSFLGLEHNPVVLPGEPELQQLPRQKHQIARQPML